MKAQDLTGQQFGKLKVLSFIGSVKDKRRYLCRCECGVEKSIAGSDLKYKGVISCGCYKNSLVVIRNKTTLAKHNKTGSPTYITWYCMKQRCHYPKDRCYYLYGGRGITVCDRWKESFEHFLEDMGERPKGMTLDRIDNSKGYFKENCKWSTIDEQAKNKRKRVKR